MFQLILNPTRDWNKEIRFNSKLVYKFQLILNPTRDWNTTSEDANARPVGSN